MSAQADADAAAADAALAAAVSSPLEVSGDIGTARSHSLPDLIAADKYQRARAAASSPRRGLRFTKLIPPGTAGDC